MDSLTPDQWQEWKAVAILDGWFDGYRKTGEIVAAINNSTNQLILSQTSPESFNEVKRSMKWWTGFEVVKNLTSFGKKQKRKLSSVAEAQKIAQQRFG